LYQVGSAPRWQPSDPKAPTTRTVYDGDQSVQEEYDPQTGQWREVGRGPRSTSQGMTVFDSEGNPIVQMGGAMGTSATTQNQKDLLAANEQLARLDRIYDGYNPDWTGAKGWGKSNWNKLKDWVGDKPDDDFKSMIGWFSDVTNNVNRTINELSGAAVTEGEAKRISAELPEVSNSWTDWGDGPTAFKAKLDAARQRLHSAIFRRRLADQYGFDWRSVPLDQLDSHPAVDRYYEALKKQYLDEGMSEDKAKAEAVADVMRQLGQEM
jgi:hypothetical protein